MPAVAALDFQGSSVDLAGALVGAVPMVDGVGACIVEPEACDAEDLASHSSRGPAADRLLCAGPGRVGQALGITRAHDGVPLDSAPFALRPAPVPPAVVVGPRIGISKAQQMPWRFGLQGSRFVSRRFP